MKKPSAFYPILTPAGAEKPPGKFNTATFWRPREAKMREKKTRFGRCFEKTTNVDEKAMRKSKVFDGSEARLALYSSLISHFRHFRIISKIG